MKMAKRKVADRREGCAEQERQLNALIKELLRIRAGDPPMSDEEIRRVRREGRP